MQGEITSLYEALVEALFLAILDPRKEKAQKAAELAECFAAGLSRHEVERAKKEVDRQVFEYLIKEAEGNVK